MTAAVTERPTTLNPVDPDEPWQTYSACAEDNWANYSLDNNSSHDPELFFPKRLEGGQCAPAKALCYQCPVRQQCLADGLKEASGVWGGLSEKERRLAQKMAKDGKTIPQILAYFDSQAPKRRRRTTLLKLVPDPAPSQIEVEAAALTGKVIEQFVDITGTVPTGAERAAEEADQYSVMKFRASTTALLEPSPEVVREQRRRRNGLR